MGFAPASIDCLGREHSQKVRYSDDPDLRETCSRACGAGRHSPSPICRQHYLEWYSIHIIAHPPTVLYSACSHSYLVLILICMQAEGVGVWICGGRGTWHAMPCIACLYARLILMLHHSCAVSYEDRCPHDKRSCLVLDIIRGGGSLGTL